MRRFLICLLLALGAASVPAAASSTPAFAGVRLPDFTPLVDRVGPAVVNIRVDRQAQSSALDDPKTREFLRRFFGVPLPQAPESAPDAEPHLAAVGSGFILRPDGLIMTNAHVVDGASRIRVTLRDKRVFDAKLVGVDKRTDIALLRIAGHGLPSVEIGDSKTLRVGAWVLAIGSPFGLENTVTAGIVSAKGRDTGDYTPFIQTDVAVNPGNSGGPLIDMDGKVVGVNSQIYSQTGGFMGISFAIPIDEAMRVAAQLEAHGYVVRGKIGVAIGPVDRELAEALGLGSARGALVQRVEPGGAAAQAGVRPGDIIVRFAGVAVVHANDLPRIVGDVQPGRQAKLQVFRSGQMHTLEVTVREWAHGGGVPALRQAPNPAASAALGVDVADLNAQQLRELDATGGVWVGAVTDEAARAGLRVGDVITRIGNVDVAGAAQFRQLAAAVPAGHVAALLVRRHGDARFVLVRRPDQAK